MAAAAFAAGVNTTLFPIFDLDAAPARTLVQECRTSLRECGLVSLPGFLREEVLREAADDARAAAPRAFSTDAWHNAYQLPGTDVSLSPTHARNVRMRTRVSSIAFDELPAERGLARLYALDCLTDFVAAVTEKPTYRLADPIGCCSVNVFHPGDFHAWHFDEAETSVTLCLQAADRGGHFEYSAPLRASASDLAVDAVATIISNTTEYAVDRPEPRKTAPEVRTAPLAPGTLQIIGGRCSLHRVSAVEGERDRLVAILCYAEEPGRVNSADVQRMFWGRTA